MNQIISLMTESQDHPTSSVKTSEQQGGYYYKYIKYKNKYMQLCKLRMLKMQ